MPPWKNSNSDLLHYRLTLIPQGQPLWDFSQRYISEFHGLAVSRNLYVLSFLQFGS